MLHLESTAQTKVIIPRGPFFGCSSHNAGFQGSSDDVYAIDNDDNCGNCDDYKRAFVFGNSEKYDENAFIYSSGRYKDLNFVTNNHRRLVFNGDGNTTLINGNSASNYFYNQLVFSKQKLTDNYSNDFFNQHAIKTRHDSSVSNNNTIAFYLWRPGQSETEIGDKNVMTLTGRGFVGIGTNVPQAGLHVINNHLIVERHGIQVVVNTANTNMDGWIGTHTNHGFYLGTNGTGSNLYLDTDNNTFVGGNSLSPVSEANLEKYNLFIKGGCLSEDYALAPSANWADYVFEDHYNLEPLHKVEEYILEHKHLPNIPSGKTVGKDGYSIKEMNVLFLEKIEELMLYTIEQDKKIEMLSNQLEQYKNLSEEIQAIKSSLKQ